MSNELTYKYFSDDDFLRISEKIKVQEKSTSGEICVSIKEGKSFLSKRKSVRELAVDEFIRLGIKKTQDNTGVLIYILLKEREFYVLADSGINEKVPENTWEAIKHEMQNMFKQGNFCDGILNGLESIGKILSLNFPIKEGDLNELSNKVVLN